MDGLTSHCHERFTNTKKGTRGVEENERKWRKGSQVSELSLFSRALAPYFGPKTAFVFPFFFPLKRSIVMFFDIDHALSAHTKSNWYK